MKKGAGASPPFLRTDPPKTGIPVEVGYPATPGSQSFLNSVASEGEQTMCQRRPGNSQPSRHLKARELARFAPSKTVRIRFQSTDSHRGIEARIHSLGGNIAVTSL